MQSIIPAELARLPSQLTSADVLVNPRTKCPGVPMKLLNYMASGAPIVSFEGSSRYLVDGQSGIVVPNEDVRSFAAGVLGLLADPTRPNVSAWKHRRSHGSPCPGEPAPR